MPITIERSRRFTFFKQAGSALPSNFATRGRP
jgi:hypothetical protein